MRQSVDKRDRSSRDSFGPALLALALLASGATRAAPPRASTEQRLRALEDRAEIEELILSDYGKAIDTSNITALSALFTEDGEYSSEWASLTAMPARLSAVFVRNDASHGDDKGHWRITFRGRPAIANFMALVATARPAISNEDGAAVATFDSSLLPDGSAPAAPPLPMPPPPGDKAGAPPGAPMARAFSMRHLVTNPHIELKGAFATATSYWTEVSTGQDGKQSLAGGGYYSDVLERANGAWRFKRRLIHNYDISPAGPPPGSLPPPVAPPAH